MTWTYKGAGLGARARFIAAIFVVLLAACGPQPSPPTATAAVTPVTAAPSRTPAPGTAVPVIATAPAAPTGTVAPARSSNLNICLVGEPASLYRYARPEPNREHILAALYDGPIDSANFGSQPVLFERLPSLAEGSAAIRATTVLSGEVVVDALGRVQPLTPGLSLRQTDGTLVVYDGGSADLPLPQMVVTFTLRPGLRWNDGAPLTADDSLFAFDIARSPDSFDPMRTTADRTASYSAPDAQTIVWIGLPGDLDPQYSANFWPPLPRHQLGSLNAAEIAASDQASRAPLGWGPFVLPLGGWQVGQSIVMPRNPDYWRGDEGLPHFDQVTYRFLAAPNDLVTGLREGMCDITPSGAAMDQAASALSGDAALQTVPGALLEHLDFNLAPAAGYTGTAATGLLADPRVRHGLAMCLDRPALEPGAPAPASYLPAAHPLAAADITPIPFDAVQGRALLAQTVTRTLTLAGDAAHQPLLQAIQNQLQKNCGVTVAPQTLTLSDLASDWPDGVIFGRRFDLAVFDWRVGAVPPCALFTTAEIASDSNPGGANDTGYSNSDFDDACAQSLALVGGAGTRAAAQAQRLWAANLPALPLFFVARHGAARPGLRGYTLDPASPSELWNIEDISLAP